MNQNIEFENQQFGSQANLAIFSSDIQERQLENRSGLLEKFGLIRKQSDHHQISSENHKPVSLEVKMMCSDVCETSEAVFGEAITTIAQTSTNSAARFPAIALIPTAPPLPMLSTDPVIDISSILTPTPLPPPPPPPFPSGLKVSNANISNP
ncbi:hypothetical protein HK096_007722, partial [Nowakowskiella sp. JEL0078]